MHNCVVVVSGLEMSVQMFVCCIEVMLSVYEVFLKGGNIGSYNMQKRVFNALME